MPNSSEASPPPESPQPPEIDAVTIEHFKGQVNRLLDIAELDDADAPFAPGEQYEKLHLMRHEPAGPDDFGESYLVELFEPKVPQDDGGSAQAIERFTLTHDGQPRHKLETHRYNSAGERVAQPNELTNLHHAIEAAGLSDERQRLQQEYDQLVALLYQASKDPGDPADWQRIARFLRELDAPQV